MEKQTMEDFLIRKSSIDNGDYDRISKFIDDFGQDSNIDKIRFNVFEEISKKYDTDSDIVDINILDNEIFMGINNFVSIEEEVERDIKRLEESINFENNVTSLKNMYKNLYSLIQKKELFDKPMCGWSSFYPDKNELKILIKSEYLSLDEKKIIFDCILIIEGAGAYYNLHKFNNVCEINKTLIALASKARFSNNWSKIYSY